MKLEGVGRVMVRRDPAAVALERAAEARRIALAKASAPEGVPFGPARGAVRVVNDYAAAPGGTRRLIGQHLEEADVFDRMCLAAVQRHKRSGAEGVPVLPFSWGQMAIARHYRALTERHSAGGVKCVSLDGSRGGGGEGFMDAHLQVGRELSALHRRIGDGSALVLRRIRPSARGTRAGISDRALVDAVCLAGRTLSDVLASHGWANNGQHREALRVALVGALDRMQGYR